MTRTDWVLAAVLIVAAWALVGAAIWGFVALARFVLDGFTNLVLILAGG